MELVIKVSGAVSYGTCVIGAYFIKCIKDRNRYRNPPHVSKVTAHLTSRDYLVPNNSGHVFSSPSPPLPLPLTSPPSLPHLSPSPSPLPLLPLSLPLSLTSLPPPLLPLSLTLTVLQDVRHALHTNIPPSSCLFVSSKK